MKAPATHKPIKPSMKPSTLLGFLLLGAIALTGSFVIWQLCAGQGSWGKLKVEQFLGAIGVSCAVIGWLSASYITLRNSVRQHTITTLLQSRLSATYMGYADTLSRHYGAYEARRKANPALRESAVDAVDILALRYILNYFEFIAIGIKRGDLDEQMLKDSLRGILRKNVAISRPWIMKEKMENSSLYENLLWLHDRWTR